MLQVATDSFDVAVRSRRIVRRRFRVGHAVFLQGRGFSDHMPIRSLHKVAVNTIGREQASGVPLTRAPEHGREVRLRLKFDGESDISLNPSAWWIGPKADPPPSECAAAA